MRAAADLGIMVPKLCATDSLDPFGSCRLCLVEIEGRRGTPASCTTPVAPGIKVATQNDRLATHPQGRDGTLHLRPPAGLPHLRRQRRLRTAGHGRRRRPARSALRLRRREPRFRPPERRSQSDLWQAKDRSNPYFQFEPSKCIVCSRCVRACEEVQGTFALTIDGRGFASHVAASMDDDFLVLRVRVLRRLRAGLPDRNADREVGRRARPARAQRRHHLRLLRRRLLVQGRDAGRARRPHGPLQGRRRQRRPLVRQGPLRLRLRHAQGSRARAR